MLLLSSESVEAFCKYYRDLQERTGKNYYNNIRGGGAAILISGVRITILPPHLAQFNHGGKNCLSGTIGEDFKDDFNAAKAIYDILSPSEKFSISILFPDAAKIINAIRGDLSPTQWHWLVSQTVFQTDMKFENQKVSDALSLAIRTGHPGVLLSVIGNMKDEPDLLVKLLISSPPSGELPKNVGEEAPRSPDQTYVDLLYSYNSTIASPQKDIIFKALGKKGLEKVYNEACKIYRDKGLDDPKTLDLFKADISRFIKNPNCFKEAIGSQPTPLQPLIL